MSHSENLLTISNLTRWYPENADKLFEHFDFTLRQGDFHVLMGQSGTGKTTLVKLITGELHAPHDTVHYRLEDLSRFTELDMEAYRKKIGIIFQDYRLFDNESVKENISYPLKIYGLGETIIETKVENIIKKLNLRKIIDMPVSSLSAGEKQKICLARALVHNPEFIIADEPTGNLDREHTQEVADMLIEANKLGNTVFLITHDIHLVHYLKDKYTIQVDILK